MKQLPLVSVIIPCYNAGAFLRETIGSVEAYPDKSVYEIVIVDDGTTDAPTLRVLDELKAQGYAVIHQPNQGPAAARNTGIRFAKGKYLLLLDSDNKIRPAYIDAGVTIFDKHPDVGVVHGNACFFGTGGVGGFQPRAFDLMAMLAENYIDNCAVIRKAVWEDLGGFDENRILVGYEDWDFWIRVGTSQWKFHYVNQTLFDYRLREDSVLAQASRPERYQAMQTYLFTKHLPLMRENYQKLHLHHRFYLNDQQRPLRSFLKYLRKRLNKY